MLNMSLLQTKPFSYQTIKMATIIDPPSGWQYGFPKPIPEEAFVDENGCPKDTRPWLVENGYPQELIDEFGEHFYCRYWEQPDESISDDI